MRHAAALDNEKGALRNGCNGRKDTGEVVEAAAPDVDKYPKGAVLAFIVVALVLSVFLSSLDFVG